MSKKEDLYIMAAQAEAAESAALRLPLTDRHPMSISEERKCISPDCESTRMSCSGCDPVASAELRNRKAAIDLAQRLEDAHHLHDLGRTNVDTCELLRAVRMLRILAAYWMPSLPPTRKLASGVINGKHVELRGWHEEDLAAWIAAFAGETRGA